MTATASLSPLPIPLATMLPLTMAAQRQARGRLYLRRRLAVVVGPLLLVALAVTLVTVLSATGVQADDGSAPVIARPVAYVVQPGDTLWTIAESLAPDADPRPIVQRLEQSAGTVMLQVGQRLVIPAELAG